VKVLLVNPYLTGATHNEAAFPLGPISLVSYVRREIPDCTIEFVDLVARSGGKSGPSRRGRRYGPSDGEIRAIMAAYQPDIVGVSSMFTSYYVDSYETAHLMREIFPNAFLVLGGAHVSYDIDESLRRTPADAVVINEGEVTFAELIRAVRDGRDLHEVAGIAFKDRASAAIVHTPKRLNYPTLDDFPRPAYEEVDYDFYSDAMIRNQLLKGNRVATIFTSRGCPYDCVFCSTKVMWTRKWRAQSAERVFEDIRYLVETFGVDEIVVNDDSFIVDRKRVTQICDLIIESGLKINLHIQAGVTVWLLTIPLLEKMVQAGLYRLRLPLETGSKETLPYVNKPVDLDASRELVPHLHKLGLWTSANFIVGFPEETREQIWQTIRYAEASTIDDVSYLIAQPYSGADMYADFERLGLLKNRIDQSSVTHTLYDTVTLKAHEIQALKDEADRRFLKLTLKRLLSPTFLVTTLWPKVNSFSKFRYALKIAWYMAKAFYGQWRYRQDEFVKWGGWGVVEPNVTTAPATSIRESSTV
jgi:radical SAM superfamily enzyme YgiQ (UPF0313 family)